MERTGAPVARINNHGQLVWAIADLLRGDYKQSGYGRVILPLVVLRRLDCVLEPTKQRVLDRLAGLRGKIENVGPILEPITGIEVYNTSPLTLKKILADPSQVAGNLRAWIATFDEETRDVIEKFDFEKEHLSAIIEVLNERFGLQLGTADQLFFDQMEATWCGDQQLVAQARANPIENFRLVFADRFSKSIVERMDDNADIFRQILDEPTFQAVVIEHYVARVFEQAQEA